MGWMLLTSDSDKLVGVSSAMSGVHSLFLAQDAEKSSTELKKRRKFDTLFPELYEVMTRSAPLTHLPEIMVESLSLCLCLCRCRCAYVAVDPLMFFLHGAC